MVSAFAIVTLLSLASLGALGTLLTLRLLKHVKKSSSPAGKEFQKIEETVRSLKTTQTITDTFSAMDHIAKILGGEEYRERLKDIRETQEKIARAMAMGIRPGGDPNTSLVGNAGVFRAPDPDIGLARVLIDIGATARRRKLAQDAWIALATTAVAWTGFALALVLGILSIIPR